MRVFHLLVIAFALAPLVGCGLDPDGATGEDGRRDVAQPIALDEWVTDDNGVSFKGGDRNDWKKIITPKSGTLAVEIAADNNDATMVVGLYDQYGKKLLEKVKLKGDSTHLTFEGDVSRGHYFLSVMARGNDDASIYSIRASMGGGYGAGDIPPPE